MKFLFTLPKIILLGTSLLVSQVYAAAVFSPVDQPLGAIGPIELSDTDLTLGAKAYRGWFENGAWQGDLIEYDVSSAGQLTTSIDLTAVSPAQGTVPTNWSAHVQFAANELTADYWNTGRKIITYTGASQVPFRWANLNAAQQQAIDLNAFSTSATSSNILNFLRGERINEYPTGTLRLRFSVLGDIIHSNPEYVAVPEANIVDSSYVTFANANASRAPRVYVGANDGMLHAFDAATGDEVWAYVPSMVVENMAPLAGRPYLHSYFVDGGITVQDALFGGNWHSVLIGSLGAGGKGLFALDVTNADLSAENSALSGDNKVLWEMAGSADNDFGYIFDASTVARLNDGKWYAINGNGVSSVNGVAKLLLIDLQTGVVKKITTGSGSAGAPNGLSAPALVDTDSDGKADVAFAGDIDGDMWKFDLTSATPASWNVDYKLFDGVGTQPITMAPDVALHPQFGHLVLYGTGRLYTADDLVDVNTQALYGIWDTGSAPIGGTRLAQLLSSDTNYTSGVFDETVRTFTTTVAIDWTTYKGWKVDLPAGERLLTQPLLRSSRLKTTITNPNGHDNWLLEVTFDEGGTAVDTIFDLDRNTILDTADRVDNNADGDLLDLEDIPMAWKTKSGMMSQVTIASLSQGFDTLFLNYLVPPPAAAACTGTCTGGLFGGHMDVDTDTEFAGVNPVTTVFGNGFAGATSEHEHEYDDASNLTYVDYFDIRVSAVGGVNDLQSITEAGIGTAPPEEFIVLVANADLSPGGELQIGLKTYNVVAYQRLIHKKLLAWDGVSSLLDDEGDSLIHTLTSLQAGGGTLRNTFDSLAITSGGLHPTQTGCVKDQLTITNGRWRNGALTYHLVRRSIFVAGSTNPLDRLMVQNPTDLKTVVVLSDGTQVNLTEDLNNNGVIDPNSPDYEVYGGLITLGIPGFLYESTLFWHFGAISELVLGNSFCYGDAGWAAAVQLETNGVTQAEYDALLAAEGLADLAELEALLATLESCKFEEEKDGGCEEQYERLLALHTLGLLNNGAFAKGGSGGSPPTGLGDITGEPVVIGGGITSGGVTSGPNFNTGRRTWTDILPQ